MSDKPIRHFSRAVVALSGSASDARILRLVLDLVKHALGLVAHAGHVGVERQRPVDLHDVDRHDLGARRLGDEAQRVLDVAEAQAEHANFAIESVLVQARDVGAAIVDEAVERDADLLVLGLPYRKRFGGDFAIGRTVPYVLKNAPCAVWVAREPMPEEHRA